MLRRGTVLVVDDEKGMCHILKRLLTDEGYTVETCNSADEALKQVEPDRFDAATCWTRLKTNHPKPPSL